MNKYTYYINYGDIHVCCNTLSEAAKCLRDLNFKRFGRIYSSQLASYFNYLRTGIAKFKYIPELLDEVISRKLQNYVECSRCKKKVFEGNEYYVDDDTGRIFCSKFCLIQSKLNAHSEIVPEG